MSYKFESPAHIFNSCKKVLERNDLYFDNVSLQKIKEFSEKIFYFEIEHELNIEMDGLKCISKYLIFGFNAALNVGDVREAIREINNMAHHYELLFFNRASQDQLDFINQNYKINKEISL